ncbi:hypothetical protein EDD86DRAFT_247371 [Gorgonomyces haynaldii]|nr:hypothetical protein EDD86DRAFT_247371 [Gorgonomyces haynaldii]
MLFSLITTASAAVQLSYSLSITSTYCYSSELRTTIIVNEEEKRPNTLQAFQPNFSSSNKAFDSFQVVPSDDHVVLASHIIFGYRPSSSRFDSIEMTVYQSNPSQENTIPFVVGDCFGTLTISRQVAE